MPVQQHVYSITPTGPQALKPTKLDSESQLEDLIVANPAILNDQWLLIGRQVRTDYGKYIDLLAVDSDGTIIIIELKKHKTPREVIAQALDYASWIEDQDSQKFADIYRHWSNGKDLSEEFAHFFEQELDEENLNADHQMVIVAAELDTSTERIVGYLNNTAGVGVGVLFFNVFADGDRRYLSRAWLSEPQEVEATPSKAASKSKSGKETWNGEFYVSYGTKSSTNARRWSNARRFGLISGGGKPWFSKTLFLLNPGDRVWVNIPKTGYVGVGIVTAPACRIDTFTLNDGSLLKDHPDLEGNWDDQEGKDDDHAEFAVAVDWVHTIDESAAVKELGFFGNQNTVARPASSKWRHTVERLKDIWNIT